MLETLLRSSISEEIPSVILQSVSTFQLRISAEQIGINARILTGIPVRICTQIKITAFSEVLIVV